MMVEFEIEDEKGELDEESIKKEFKKYGAEIKVSKTGNKTFKVIINSHEILI